MRRSLYGYILVSEPDARKHYTSITRDLSGRLQEHNRGHCPHTAKYKPWRIETAVAFASESKARAFEKCLKTDPAASLLVGISNLSATDGARYAQGFNAKR